MAQTEFRGWATAVAQRESIDGDAILGTPPAVGDRTYTLGDDDYTLEEVSLSEEVTDGQTKFTITLAHTSSTPADDVFELCKVVTPIFELGFQNEFVANASLSDYFAVGDSDSATTPLLSRGTTGSYTTGGVTYYYRRYIWDVLPFDDNSVLSSAYHLHFSQAGKIGIVLEAPSD